MERIYRRIKSIVCIITIILSMINICTISSFALPQDGRNKASAVLMTFGKTYNKTWDAGTTSKHYSKFSVPERGVLTLNFTKPYDSDYDFRTIYLKVYSTDGDMIFDSWTNSDQDGLTSTTLLLGVEAGDYYLEMDLGIFACMDALTTQYSVQFSASEEWEIEPNDKMSSATKINLNKMYNGLITGNDEVTEKDAYKFVITSENKNYKIYIGNFKRIDREKVSIRLKDPDGKIKTVQGHFEYDDTGMAYYNIENPKNGTWYVYFDVTDGIVSYRYIYPVRYTIGVYEGAENVDVYYKTHVQTYGWQRNVSNGAVSGTSGKAKRLEAINISISGNKKLGIQYTTHCQSYGWLPWSANGEMNGTEGEAKRLEAIKIQLTGADKDKYDVYYRVHAQTYGWLGWAKNGAPAGTAGYAKRLEAIQIVVVKKGESINTKLGNITSARNEAYIAAISAQNPVIPSTTTTNVSYRTHVQTYGWQGWKYNGQVSGTSGQAKRLEGINIKLTNKQYSGGIAYTTHVQTYGWQGNVNDSSTWKKDGEMAGTSGQAKRLEAIQIRLTGEMANHYDVYYRVHAQTYGWLNWAKNGEPSGTAGYAKRLEGIQIVLVEKGSSAPSKYYGGVRSVQTRAYISK